MAFGNVITDGTQVAVGTYGYVVSFDLSAERVASMKSATMQLDGDQLSNPADTPEASLGALFTLCEDANASDFAWYYNSGYMVYVFCKTSVYPYASNVRVAFEYYTIPQPLAATSDEVMPERLPEESKELLKALTLQSVYNLTGARIPREVTNTIAAQRSALGV